MNVPTQLAQSIRTRWPDRADRWLASVEAELDELCSLYSATPQRVLPARFAFVVSAKTRDHSLIMRATADPEASAQQSVASALAQLGVAPRIHTVWTTATGTWLVMDQVTPGIPLANVDPRTLDLDNLTQPLHAMAGVRAPTDELPLITDWLRNRLLDDHLDDLPPGETTAQPDERKRALDVLNELTVDAHPGLCHGDTSPWNILAGRNGQWMLIDPRGFRGEVEYDAAVMAIKLSTVHSVRNATTQVADAAQLDCNRVRAWENVARVARI